MQGILDYLFGAASFIPHGYCLLWRPDLVALHAISDALIALAYFSIPVTLALFIHRRRDLEFGWIFGLFALFIFACGLTHVVGLITLWQPVYGLHGLIKAVTAVASLATAALVWPIVPRALAVPGTGELRALNEQLLSGIERERETGRQLQFAFVEIEQRVAERTRQLAETNDRLRAEVMERRRAEQQQEMLLAELRHRTRNTLAIVKSIAAQTRQHSRSIDAFSRSFNARVQALADTHTLLFDSNWSNSALQDLVRQHLRPYGGDQRARLEGPAIAVRPKAALSLSLVLHELAANAAKYGALSSSVGEVVVEWRLIEAGEGPPNLEIAWRETGGPVVSPPARRGFGSEVIEFTIALEFQGEVRFDYRPEGLAVRLVLPLIGGML